MLSLNFRIRMHHRVNSLCDGSEQQKNRTLHLENSNRLKKKKWKESSNAMQLFIDRNDIYWTQFFLRLNFVLHFSHFSHRRQLPTHTHTSTENKRLKLKLRCEQLFSRMYTGACCSVRPYRKPSSTTSIGAWKQIKSFKMISAQQRAEFARAHSSLPFVRFLLFSHSIVSFAWCDFFFFFFANRKALRVYDENVCALASSLTLWTRYASSIMWMYELAGAIQMNRLTDRNENLFL